MSPRIALLISPCLVLAANAAPDQAAFPMDWSTHAQTAVDLSRHLDAPAGKGGFIRATDGRLVKPDGSRFRIWGVNICGPACFPAQADAVALAGQLARMGVNCVRFHHMDSNWSVMFDKSRNDTRQLSPGALDRMDFLVAEFKKRGIYVNLNLNVGRRFTPGDGVRDADKLGYGKSCTYFNPRLIELQHEFARQLLTHANPYTGNEYRHEPCVATVEIVNENSVIEGWGNGRLVGLDVGKPDTWSPIPVSYAGELTDLFNEWLAKNRPAETLATIRAEAGVAAGAPVPRLEPPGFDKASPARFRTEAEFYIDVEHRFFAGMKRLLKDELGVKAPVVGTADHSDRTAAYAHIEANAMFDWIDGHGYWQHPNYRAETPTCENTPMVNDPLDSTVTQFARTPVAGRAFTISEVNHPFPHESACEGFPILTAYSMFHDWDGIYWFTWDNGKPSKDGGIPPRAFFTIPPDPVKIANLMACGALWHQGGIAPARQTIVRSYTREQMIDALRMNRNKERPFFTPGFDRSTPLVHATRFRFDGGPATAFPPAAPLGGIISDTGELAWTGADKQQGLVSVDAAGAQALIGHVRESGRSTKHLAADVKNGFCSLVLVPLDGKPVARSSRMLLAATGWCGNTGMKWSEERNAIPGWGRGPVLIEPVTGTVTLRGLDARSVSARALTAAGAPMDAVIPVTVSRGAFTLTLGTPAATMLLIGVTR
jgi:hypothetical protein